MSLCAISAAKHHLKLSCHWGFPVLPPLSYGSSESDNTAQDLIASSLLRITMVFSGELVILSLLNYTPFQHGYCFLFVNYGFSTLLYLSMTQRGEHDNIMACSIEFKYKKKFKNVFRQIDKRPAKPNR